jgi:quinol monooxygenase YgiN
MAWLTGKRGYSRKMFDRRTLLRAIAAIAVVPDTPTLAQRKPPMYGLIGKMITQPGQRDALIAVLLEGTADMAGCLSYIVARDSTDENAIWITEVWDSEASHKASLGLPAVRAAIAKGRPLIASFGAPVITVPAGGQGIRG